MKHAVLFVVTFGFSCLSSAVIAGLFPSYTSCDKNSPWNCAGAGPGTADPWLLFDGCPGTNLCNPTSAATQGTCVPGLGWSCGPSVQCGGTCADDPNINCTVTRTGC